MGGCLATVCCCRCRGGFCARRCGCCKAHYDEDMYYELKDPANPDLLRLVPKALHAKTMHCSDPFFGILEFEFISFQGDESTNDLTVKMQSTGDTIRHKENGLSETFIFVIDKSDEIVRFKVKAPVQKGDKVKKGKVFRGELNISEYNETATHHDFYQMGQKWQTISVDVEREKHLKLKQLHLEKHLNLASEKLHVEDLKIPPPAKLKLKVRYQFVRGPRDGGSCFGPGYLYSTRGWSGRQGSANHWVCSHDNVYVLHDDEGVKDPTSQAARAMAKIDEKRAKLAEAFAPLIAQNENEGVKLLARTTEDFLGQMQTAVSTIQLDIQQENAHHAFNQEHGGVAMLNATAVSSLHYNGPAGLLRSAANKNILLTIASARRWQEETAACNHLAHTSGSDDLQARDLISFMDESPEFDAYMEVTRDLNSDSDGNVIKSIPKPRCLDPDLYNVRLTVPSDHTTGMGQIFCLRAGTPCVLFDCDGTLTTGDEEVVKQFMLGAFSLDDIYDPMAQPGAATCCRLWASKGYQCVYLSGRAGAHHQMSNNWLMSHGFPPGPVHLTRTSTPTLPIYSSVGVFKVAYMEELKEKGCEIYACYGNTPTDIKAYEAIGLPKERIFIAGPHGPKNTDRVTAVDYQTHNPTILDLNVHPNASTCIPYQSMSWGPVFVGEDDTADKKYSRKTGMEEAGNPLSSDDDKDDSDDEPNSGDDSDEEVPSGPLGSRRDSKGDHGLGDSAPGEGNNVSVV